MKFNIYQIAIEVTRNCNLVCENYCMRGQRQEININKEDVDSLLNMINRPNIEINHLLFSGGEPTLNEDIIVYIIDEIISKKIPIREIGMVTNGHIISYPIIEAFERFNFYKKEELKDEIQLLTAIAKVFGDESIIPGITNFARIAISKDRFHKPLSEDKMSLYQEACKNIMLYSHFMSDDMILKTGLATTGEDFEYHLDQISFSVGDDIVDVSNYFYLTSTGFLTTNGDGMYQDMDLNNLGHIQEIDLIKMIEDEVNKKTKHQENVKQKKISVEDTYG